MSLAIDSKCFLKISLSFTIRMYRIGTLFISEEKLTQNCVWRILMPTKTFKGEKVLFALEWHTFGDPEIEIYLSKFVQYAKI